MEQYSPAELSELFLQAQALIDTQFQYWMSITFAVVVAGFVAGERLEWVGQHRLRATLQRGYPRSSVRRNEWGKLLGTDLRPIAGRSAVPGLEAGGFHRGPCRPGRRPQLVLRT